MRSQDRGSIAIACPVRDLAVPQREYVRDRSVDFYSRAADGSSVAALGNDGIAGGDVCVNRCRSTCGAFAYCFKEIYDAACEVAEIRYYGGSIVYPLDDWAQVGKDFLDVASVESGIRGLNDGSV